MALTSVTDSCEVLNMEITKEEIFDIVSRHLWKQAERSFASGVCLYRGMDGTKCAVGALIDDDEYREAMEECDVLALLDSGLLPLRLLPHTELLQRLQTIHDRGVIERWPQALADVAFQFGIKCE